MALLAGPRCGRGRRVAASAGASTRATAARRRLVASDRSRGRRQPPRGPPGSARDREHDEADDRLSGAARAEDGREPHGPRYDAEPAESVAGLIEGERLTVHDLLVGDDAAERQRRGGTVATASRARSPRSSREMNRPRRARPRPAPTTRTRSGSTRRATTRPPRTSPHSPRAARRQALPPDRGDAEGEADQRGPRPDRHQHQHAAAGATRRWTGSRPAIRPTPATSSSPRRSATAYRCSQPCSARRPRRSATTRPSSCSTTAIRSTTARSPIDRGGEEASAGVRYEDEPLSLVAKQGVTVEVRDDQRVRIDAEAPAEVEGPIADGERLGRATVTVDGRFVDRVPLVAARAIAAPTTSTRSGAAGRRADRLRRDRHTFRSRDRTAPPRASGDDGDDRRRRRE